MVKSLLSQVEELMKRNGAERAVEVNVSIGEFAGVERDLFKIAFDDMVADSSARGARLHVQAVPLEGRCDTCKQTFAISDFKFQCKLCGCRHVTLLRGEELILDSVIMEQTTQ